MKKNNYSLLLFTFFILLLLTGCTNYPVIQEPDVQKFNETVNSQALRDSLMQGKLTSGMPQFVLGQLFKNWTGKLMETKIPVASLGSKQRLEESEGLYSTYVDPNINIFLDKYDTPAGYLFVWYQRPNFYSMDVSSRDTLCVFVGDTVYCSVIKYLNKSSMLTVRDSLPQIPVNTKFYAEIHYNENRWPGVSYWYNLKMYDNARTFKLGDTNYEFYPIKVLELNNEPVTSFKWREVNNENSK